MTGALIRKELRELRAWGVLSLLIGLLDIFSSFTTQIDMLPLGRMFVMLTDGVQILFWLMAFAVGTGLTTREHDDKTLMFLDGLPVSRTRVFFVKCVVTVLLVLLAPLVRFTTASALHLLSRGSLDHAVHPELLAQVLSLQVLLVCNGLFLGAALGRLRNVTWLVAGALASGLLLLIRYHPRAALLNPLALLDTQLSSAGLIVDMETVGAQFCLAVLGLLIAWHGFLRAGKTRVATIPTRPLVGAAITVLTTITLGAAIILFVQQQTEQSVATASPSASSDLPYFPPSPPAQTATQHYRFSYPAHEAAAALVLAEEADEIFEQVHALLGTDPGQTIDVDASGSMHNTHGTAYFGRIRMVLANDARVVLAHETAHVVTQRMAGEHRDWLWQSAPVLNEGLASWVDAKFDESPAQSDARLLILAVLHARRELIIDEFASPSLLGMMRDENIKYPAGETLITAAVRLYGEPAIARLLHAFNDPQLPTDLSGLPLWQATFQLAEMDLGAVIDDFYREVAAYAAQHAREIAALPRPRVRLVAYEGMYGVQPLLAENEPVQKALTLRFKPAADSTYETVDTQLATAFQPVWRNRSDIAGGRICVQAGIEAFPDTVLYEPWICLPLSDAGPWEP